MTGIDLLTIDPHDPAAVAALVHRLQGRFTAAECRQLLADLDAWNAHHDAAMRTLAHSKQWQRLEQWRARIHAATGEDAA